MKRRSGFWIGLLVAAITFASLYAIAGPSRFQRYGCFGYSEKYHDGLQHYHRGMFGNSRNERNNFYPKSDSLHNH